MRYRTVGLPVRLPDSGRVTDQPQVMNEAEQIWILLGSLTVMRDPSSESGGRCVGRIFDRRGWNLSHLSDPLGGFLLGLKQLLHGHGLVDMVLGLSDLFTGDQEPHIGVHQVLRPSATSGVELCQRWLCDWQALRRAPVLASVARSRRRRSCG
jgi:hypothetical protein